MLTFSLTPKIKPKYPHIPSTDTFLKDHKAQLYYMGCLTQTKITKHTNHVTQT